MPDNSNKNLMKLRKLLSLMDEEAITKEDFLTLSKNIVGFMVKNQQVLADKTNKTIADLNALFKDLENKVSTKSDLDVKTAIKELKGAVEKALREQENGMNFLRDKVRGLKNGDKGDKGDNGKDGSPDTPEEIRNKLEGLNGDERIDKSAIRGLEELIRGIGKGTGLTFFGGGGVSKMSMDRYIVDPYTPTGTIDGSNTDFTLVKAPNPTASLKVWRGGALQSLTEDYTLSGKTVTFLVAPVVGEILKVEHRI